MFMWLDLDFNCHPSGFHQVAPKSAQHYQYTITDMRYAISRTPLPFTLLEKSMDVYMLLMGMLMKQYFLYTFRDRHKDISLKLNNAGTM